MNLNGQSIGNLNFNDVSVQLNGIFCCFETNELFVGDCVNKKIYVIDLENQNSKRIIANEQLNTCHSLLVDFERFDSSTLYVCEPTDNMITLFDAQTGILKRKFQINSPIDAKIRGERMYVISGKWQYECLKLRNTNKKIKTTDNIQSVLYIVDKRLLKVLKTVTLKGCYGVCGLQINRFLNEVNYCGYEIDVIKNKRNWSMYAYSENNEEKIVKIWIDDNCDIKDVAFIDNTIIVLKENSYKKIDFI